MKDARTRAEESRDKAYANPDGMGLKHLLPDDSYILGYLAGDSDRERLMKEESGKGFDEWWDGYIHADTFTRTAKETWRACALSYEKRLAEKDAEIKRLVRLCEERAKEDDNQFHRISELESELREVYRRLDEEWGFHLMGKEEHPSPWIFINCLRGIMPNAAKLITEIKERKP